MKILDIILFCGLVLALALIIADSVQRMRQRATAFRAVTDMQTALVEALERCHNDLKGHVAAQGETTRGVIVDHLDAGLRMDIDGMRVTFPATLSAAAALAWVDTYQRLRADPAQLKTLNPPVEPARKPAARRTTTRKTTT